MATLDSLNIANLWTSNEPSLAEPLSSSSSGYSAPRAQTPLRPQTVSLSRSSVRSSIYNSTCARPHSTSGPFPGVNTRPSSTSGLVPTVRSNSRNSTASRGRSRTVKSLRHGLTERSLENVLSGSTQFLTAGQTPLTQRGDSRYIVSLERVNGELEVAQVECKNNLCHGTCGTGCSEGRLKSIHNEVGLASLFLAPVPEITSVGVENRETNNSVHNDVIEVCMEEHTQDIEVRDSADGVVESTNCELPESVEKTADAPEPMQNSSTPSSGQTVSTPGHYKHEAPFPELDTKPEIRSLVQRKQSTRLVPVGDRLVTHMEDSLMRWKPPQSSQGAVGALLSGTHPYQNELPMAPYNTEVNRPVNHSSPILGSLFKSLRISRSDSSPEEVLELETRSPHGTAVALPFSKQDYDKLFVNETTREVPSTTRRLDKLPIPRYYRQNVPETSDENLKTCWEQTVEIWLEVVAELKEIFGCSVDAYDEQFRVAD